MKTSTCFILSVVLLGAAAPAVAQTGDGQRPSPGSAVSRPASWSGTWDIIGTNFAEGARTAVLTIERRDTVCICNVQGPPGRMLASVFKGDSLHIVWELGPDEHMITDLALENGSISGTWRIDGHAGEIFGTRQSP